MRTPTTTTEPLRLRWERMSWHARARFMRDLIARERAVQEAERRIYADAQDEREQVRTIPASTEIDSAMTRAEAERILATLSTDDPAEIRLRREIATRPRRVN